MDWSIVKSHHVASAIADYGAGPPSKRTARNTFLLVGDRRLAAKFVRGLAYQKATGKQLDPSRDFGGGMETVQFFLRRGYSVEHEGRRYEPAGAASSPRSNDATRVARVAAISIEGDPWPTGKNLAVRCRFLEELHKHLPVDVRLDAVQLPGGFLTFDGHLPATGFADRKAFLEQRQHPFAKSCMAAARDLDGHSPGAALCVGIDSPNQGKTDQLNVAWRPDGIAAIARKIFPTSSEGAYLVCDADDYATPRRYLDLPSGHTALLCDCYDVYGCADHEKDGTRPRYIRRLSSKGTLLARPSQAFSKQLGESLDQFSTELRRRRPQVVLGAIHWAQSGTHTYWHKNGIPDASAALEGALVVGGVHFWGIPFPSDPSRYPYAASRVSRKRLSAPDKRRRKVLAHNPVAPPIVVAIDKTSRARIAIFEP